MRLQKFHLADSTELAAPMGVPISSTSGVGQNGYQVFLQDNVRGIILHMEAVNRATKMFFKDVYHVLHPFGGLGMAAQCMDKTIKDDLNHEFWERDQNCCDALKILYPKSPVYQVNDSFALLAEPRSDFRHYGLVFIDPTAMTCKKEKLWDVWKNMANNEVQNLWFVDSAISKIWLHTRTYSEFYEDSVYNIQDYFRCYNDKLNKLGLKIVDLCREGTVVYGVVKPVSAPQPVNLAIHDLRP